MNGFQIQMTLRFQNVLLEDGKNGGGTFHESLQIEWTKAF